MANLLICLEWLCGPQKRSNTQRRALTALQHLFHPISGANVSGNDRTKTTWISKEELSYPIWVDVDKFFRSAKEELSIEIINFITKQRSKFPEECYLEFKILGQATYFQYTFHVDFPFDVLWSIPRPPAPAQPPNALPCISPTGDSEAESLESESAGAVSSHEEEEQFGIEDSNPKAKQYCSRESVCGNDGEHGFMLECAPSPEAESSKAVSPRDYMGQFGTEDSCAKAEQDWFKRCVCENDVVYRFMLECASSPEAELSEAVSPREEVEQLGTEDSGPAAEQDWSIKCVCRIDEERGFMLECASCTGSIWQHHGCYYPDLTQSELKEPGFVHSCTECKPRDLTSQEAYVAQAVSPVISESTKGITRTRAITATKLVATEQASFPERENTSPPAKPATTLKRTRELASTHEESLPSTKRTKNDSTSTSQEGPKEDATASHGVITEPTKWMTCTQPNTVSKPVAKEEASFQEPEKTLLPTKPTITLKQIRELASSNEESLPPIKRTKSNSMTASQERPESEDATAPHEINAKLTRGVTRTRADPQAAEANPPLKKTKNSAWNDVEFQMLFLLIKAQRDEEEEKGSRTLRDTKFWGLMSEELAQHKIVRSSTACKNFWSRIGRERSGFDERANPNPEKLSTSVQTKSNGKKGSKTDRS